MPTRFTRTVLNCLLLCLSVAHGAIAQQRETLFLPGDEQRVDDLTIVGTIETRGLRGLSRLSVPGDASTYYVIDQVAAFQARIAEALADVERNDSDISIRGGVFGDEFVHLRFKGGVTEVRYYRFEERLQIQLRKFFETGGFSNGSGIVEFDEYRFPTGACLELEPSTTRMRADLRDAGARIGERVIVDRDTITVDGLTYQISARMGLLLVGRLAVGPDAGSLYDSANSIMTTVRNCRFAVEPETRTRDF